MIEQLRPGVCAGNARVAIFDFDGTVSLIRSGWMDIILEIMMEGLRSCRTGESESDLRRVAEDDIWRLTGKPTIYQMRALVDAMCVRGGQPLDAEEYRQIFLTRLGKIMEARIADLRRGGDPNSHLVPGTQALLTRMRERGLTLYLASGTDHDRLQEEAKLLGIASYFDGGIFGASSDLDSSTKEALIRRILAPGKIEGKELLGFGDGCVEIENIHDAGGITVGVASDEPECRKINQWKRTRLAAAGADYIIPHYQSTTSLLEKLFNGKPGKTAAHP
ncbi:MAG TPA: HAD family hydrolase [Bryobacteraceae bacterium]|nr:HAD family hydrolase [Bryobacteraceae bacterium]